MRRVSHRVMAVVLASGQYVLRLICGYSPQSRRCLGEKQCFCDELKGE